MKETSAGEVKVARISMRATRNTVGFAVLLVAMWYAALSQGNGAAYALFFFLGAIAVVSWLHARRNLRGLRLRAGRIEPVFAGGELHVPLTLAADSGNFAAGVEVRSVGSANVVRTGYIQAGGEVPVEVAVSAMRRGAFPKILVEVRSLWPMGIFAASARVELDAPHVVYPAPAGNEPMPEGAPGWQYDRRRGRGDGDEFAGLREIRPGENPRRIHWRAAERTERLLIKEWEGAAGGVRWLQWDDVAALATDARIAQLAQWVLQADRTGSPYGLRIPGAEIAPAMGPAHRARCLQALAATMVVPESKPPRPRRPAEGPILPRPLGLLLTALGLGMVPLLSTVQTFSAGLLVCAILFRIITRKRGIALRSVPMKLLVCGIGVGGVFFSGSGLLGLQPGMSLLIGLLALKILETVTRRDFFVVMLLAWFVALCGLFLSQTLMAGLGAAGLAVAAAIAAAQLYSEDRLPLWITLKRMGLLTAHALPIVALLFLFFPRVHSGFRLMLGPNSQGAAGFSEDFEPGSFAQLNENFDTAFRVEFLESAPPQPSDRYWRGVVLWQCEGLTWRRGTVQSIEPPPLHPPAGALRQRVTLQPHGNRWLFALDRPITAPKEGVFEPGGCLQAYRPVNRSTRYEVVSVPGYHEERLTKEQLRASTELPTRLPPETRKLVAWLKEPENAAAILSRGLEWFRAQGFTYSLTPDKYEGINALDEFLFRRRTGFCSHYAGAFATLMRAAGLPSRVVLGYQGGEYNPKGHYFQVRQNDAHAWSEVWIAGRGWQRIDLTQQIAPERLEAGAERFRETVAQGFGGGFHPPAGLRDLFDRARMFWDSVNYQWDLRVVAYDEDAQYEFLANWNLQNLPRPYLLGSIFVAVSVLFGGAGLWLRHATAPKHDAATRAWLRACREIARVSGRTREIWEGPQAYTARAAAARPEAAEPIRSAGEVYSRIRYGDGTSELSELRAAADQLRRFKSAKAQL